MSWTDKELSDMARKAEADHAFAYQDSFWGEMEAMLPAKKKRLWPYFIGIAIPVLGVTAFLLSSPELPLETANAAKTAIFDRNEIINLNRSTANPNAESYASANVSVSNSSSVSNENVTINTQVKDVSEKRSEFKKEDVSDNLTSNVEANATIEKESQSRAIAPIIAAKELPVVAENTSKTVETTERQETLMAVNLPKVKEQSDVLTQISRLDYAQLSTIDMQQTAQPTMLKYSSKRRFFSAYGELGFTIGEAYLNTQASHVQAVSLGAGVRLTKNKLFVQSGLGFEVEKAGVELNETTREYGYGIKTFENRMNYKDMFRVFIPVNVGYMFNKHTLQLGATASYLMSTKMKYAYLEDNSVKRNETIYGERKGWNSFGMKLNVGYGFTLFPSTTIGANFQVQLMNQLNTNWVKDENKLPISGQVFIRKTLR
jgi:hypothetical protein